MKNDKSIAGPFIDAHKKNKEIVKEKITKQKAKDNDFQVKFVAHMAAMGFKDKKEIAQAVGCSVERVRALFRSELFCEQVEKLQSSYFEQNFDKMFKQIIPTAVRTAHRMLTDKNTHDSVRAKIAFDFMDRGLGKPTQKIEDDRNLIAQLYDQLDETKQKNNIDIKDIEDADYEDV